MTDPNLVVSPLNSRNDFTTLINAAQGASGDGNNQGIAAIKQGGVQVRHEPPDLIRGLAAGTHEFPAAGPVVSSLSL